MIISELFDPAPKGYYNEKDDQSVTKKTDSRTNRITLAHLNQLRQSHDVRKLEHEQKLQSVSKQYSVPAEAAGGAL
jgi:uncharacterized protein YkwD